MKRGLSVRLHYSLDAETELNEELITEAAQCLSHTHTRTWVTAFFFSQRAFFLIILCAYALYCEGKRLMC